MKNREIAAVLDFLAVGNFDLTRKIVKKNLGEKLVKMLGFCQNWIFALKFDFSNSLIKTYRNILPIFGAKIQTFGKIHCGVKIQSETYNNFLNIINNYEN